MELINDLELHEKLRKTTWITIIHAFFLGMQYSCIYTSLFFYLQNMFQVVNIKVYYGAIMGILSLSASISELFMNTGFRKAYLGSLTRVLVVFILLPLVGNLLYSLFLSIWFVYIGVFLCGTGDSVQAIVFDSLSKCLDNPADLSSVRVKYERSYTIGFVFGPALVAMLATLNIRIGEWHIIKYNGIGFILALGLCIVLVLVLYGVSDVIVKGDSELDPYEKENQKAAEKKNYNQALATEDDDKSNSKVDYQYVSYLFTNIDVLLLLISSTVVSFLANSTEMLITVTAATEADLNITTYSIMMCGCLVIYTIMISKFWNFYFSYRKKREFKALIVCLVLVLLSCCLIILPNIRHSQTTLAAKRFFLFLAILTNSTAGVSISNACFDLFFKHTPEQYLESIERFRANAQRVFGLVGLVLSGMIYQYVTFIYTGFIIVILLLIAVFMTRKKHSSLTATQESR